MLVLSRSPNEKIFVLLPDGQKIEILITQMRYNKVRLGFTAPPTVKIMREELLPENNAPAA